MRNAPIQQKPLFFVGDSRKSLKEFPAEVQAEIGHALNDAQWGGKSHSVKPLKGFGGTSVLEVVEPYNTNTYRAVYTVRFERAVYVLHCFQKKAKSGIATTQQDVKLIESRLKFAAALYEKFQEQQG